MKDLNRARNHDIRTKTIEPGIRTKDKRAKKEQRHWKKEREYR